MKKTLLLFSMILLAASCGKENVSVCETLQVQSPETKVRLAEDLKAVWDAGDKVSVFFNGGSNECWNYSGADGASKGSISHEGTAWRIGNGRFTAVYPYNAGASMAGNVISTTIPAVQTYRPSSYGWALLVSSTENASLQFSYACAFLKISLAGKGVVKTVTVQGNNGEALSGTARVDISGNNPATTLSSGGKTITLSKGNGTLETLGSTEKDFWIALPPGNYTNGFTVSVGLDSGSTETISVSGMVKIANGEVYAVHSRIYSFFSVTANLTNRNAFTPALPAGANATEGTYQFTSGGGQYSITCHSSDGRFFGMYEGSFLIGFGGAWIKIPTVEGYTLYEVEYTTAGQAGQPYLSTTKDNPKAVSNQIPDKITVGQSYTMTLKEVVPDQQYYLIVGAGNLRMSRLTFRYIAK